MLLGDKVQRHGNNRGRNDHSEVGSARMLLVHPDVDKSFARNGSTGYDCRSQNSYAELREQNHCCAPYFSELLESTQMRTFSSWLVTVTSVTSPALARALIAASISSSSPLVFATRACATSQGTETSTFSLLFLST